MTIDTNGVIADFLNVGLTAIRRARDVARAAGSEDALGLFMLSQQVAGAVSHHAGKAAEQITGQPSEELSPFEAEVMMVVRQHGKIGKQPIGTMADYAVQSLLKRTLLVRANPEGSEYILPRYLPLGEDGAMVLVSRGAAYIYDQIMAGNEYVVPNNEQVRHSVIRQCNRLVDAGLASWWEGKLVKSTTVKP